MPDLLTPSTPLPYGTAAAPSETTARGSRTKLPTFVASLGIVSLWLLTRPYGGIVHDARLYIGQVLASVDPAGVGRDLMFALDGQFGFTIFPEILALAVRSFGTSNGAMLVALVGLLVWIGGMAALASRIAQCRTFWAILIFVCVLPSKYGAFGVFHFGEPLAIPRPFSEAAVLVALALAISGRTALAFPVLMLAAVLHPIVVLPGIAVILGLLVWNDRRWISLLALAAAGTLAAAAIDLPVAGRLLTLIDQEWRNILNRNAYLFPTLWPYEAWSWIVVQASTIFLAADLVANRVRALFLTVVVVSLGGLLVALLLGDMVPTLLVVQVQPWRATWLLGVFASMALAICTVQMWKRGSLSRVCLGFVALAWMTAEHLGFSTICCVFALTLQQVERRQAPQIRPALLYGVWVIALVSLAYSTGLKTYTIFRLLGSKPEDAYLGLLILKLVPIHVPFVVIATSVWAVSGRDLRLATTAATILFATAALLLWDGRDPRRAAADQMSPGTVLLQRLADSPGEVLWLGDDPETWNWTGRPNWFAGVQGASILFSRPLAVAFSTRLERLLTFKLADESLRNPYLHRWENPWSNRLLSQDRLAQFCSARDAPSWIFGPADAFTELPKEAQAVRYSWRPPYPSFRIQPGNTSEVVWQRSSPIEILKCKNKL